MLRINWVLDDVKRAGGRRAVGLLGGWAVGQHQKWAEAARGQKKEHKTPCDCGQIVKRRWLLADKRL